MNCRFRHFCTTERHLSSTLGQNVTAPKAMKHIFGLKLSSDRARQKIAYEKNGSRGQTKIAKEFPLKGIFSFKNIASLQQFF